MCQGFRGRRCASAADISVPRAGGSPASDRISQHAPQGFVQVGDKCHAHKTFMSGSEPLQIFITPPLIKQPSLVV